MSILVVLDVNVRLARRSKCSLYSVDPSCGSASSFVIPVSCRRTGLEYDWESALLEPRRCGSSRSPAVGVLLPGVDQGDDTLGGLGSYVNMDAIIAEYYMCLAFFSMLLSYGPPYVP
jgi:hypothetical protein